MRNPRCQKRRGRALRPSRRCRLLQPAGRPVVPPAAGRRARAPVHNIARGDAGRSGGSWSASSTISRRRIRPMRMASGKRQPPVEATTVDRCPLPARSGHHHAERAAPTDGMFQSASMSPSAVQTTRTLVEGLVGESRPAPSERRFGRGQARRQVLPRFSP